MQNGVALFSPQEGRDGREAHKGERGVTCSQGIMETHPTPQGRSERGQREKEREKVVASLLLLLPMQAG